MVVVLHGEHDLTTAPALRSELDRAYAIGTAVVADLSMVEFLDGTVLANLVHARDEAGRAADRSFAIIAPPGSVARRLIELIELGKTVPVYADRIDAIAAIRAHEDTPPT